MWFWSTAAFHLKFASLKVHNYDLWDTEIITSSHRSDVGNQRQPNFGLETNKFRPKIPLMHGICQKFCKYPFLLRMDDKLEADLKQAHHKPTPASNHTFTAEVSTELWIWVFQSEAGTGGCTVTFQRCYSGLLRPCCGPHRVHEAVVWCFRWCWGLREVWCWVSSPLWMVESD